MKHILWLASWYPDEMSPFNGDFIQRHARAVAQRLPITVIYMAQHGPDVNVSLAGPHVGIREGGNLFEQVIYFRYRKTGLHKPDILRYNWNFFYHYRRYLRQYIARHGKPDLVHVHIPMKAGRMAIWLLEKYGIPFIVSEHSSAYSDEVPDNYHNRGEYYRKWVKLIFEKALAVTTVSQKLGDRLQELFAIQSMHIIPNVADTQYFRPAGRDGAERFRFLHASTMDHPKNVEGILKAMARLKSIRQDWDCTMLGWDTPALRKLSSDLGLERHITWKGVVSYHEVAVEMQQASALVLFSRYENQPCVILESLSTGLPVIATRVGGIPEIVNDTNGILVDQGHEDQLLQAMVDLMNNRSRFDQNVISDHAQQRYSYEAVGKQFADLYDKYSGKS